MGTVMSLIVLVGLWSLPQLTRRRTTRFDDATARLHAGHAETEVSAARTADRLGGASEQALDSSQPSAAGAASAKSDLEAGLTHFHAREYASAAPLLARAAVVSSDAEQARALLYLARSERALGHCERAVDSYNTLVRSHPAMSEALAALREGVACYDHLAEPGRAQRLLEQAASTPALAAGARSLLVQRAAGGGRKSGSPARPAAPARSN
jgi:tetratricopeptide (TPR) repeat protein